MRALVNSTWIFNQFKSHTDRCLTSGAYVGNGPDPLNLFDEKTHFSSKNDMNKAAAGFCIGGW